MTERESRGGFKGGIWTALKDLYKIFILRTEEAEQNTESKFGSRCKMWLERHQDNQHLRRLIHALGPEALQLHLAFNGAALKGQKALVWAAVLHTVVGFFIGLFGCKRNYE